VEVLVLLQCHYVVHILPSAKSAANATREGRCPYIPKIRNHNVRPKHLIPSQMPWTPSFSNPPKYSAWALHPRRNSTSPCPCPRPSRHKNQSHIPPSCHTYPHKTIKHRPRAHRRRQPQEGIQLRTTAPKIPLAHHHSTTQPQLTHLSSLPHGRSHSLISLHARSFTAL
jgi:hypothetical protein